MANVTPSPDYKDGWLYLTTRAGHALHHRSPFQPGPAPASATSGQVRAGPVPVLLQSGSGLATTRPIITSLLTPTPRRSCADARRAATRRAKTHRIRRLFAARSERPFSARGAARVLLLPRTAPADRPGAMFLRGLSASGVMVRAWRI